MLMSDTNIIRGLTMGLLGGTFLCESLQTWNVASCEYMETLSLGLM